MHSLPQEIEVWYIIPAIRGEFAREMERKGIKQAEIARKLNITRAAVSQYISKKRASEIKFDGAVKKKISEGVQKLIKGACPIKEIQDICSYVKKNGHLCKIHCKIDKADKCCGVCFS